MTQHTLHPLSHFSFIAVEGPDAHTFLQGQMTCDVRAISPQKASVGALCDAKGRMQATFLLYQQHETYFLVVPKVALTHTLKRLKKYAVFSKVHIRDVTPAWFACGIHDKTQPPFDEFYAVSPHNELLTLSWPGHFSRLLMLSNNETQSTDAYQKYVTRHFTLSEESAWQLENILQGLADILPTTSGLFLPQMINLQHWAGVSFKKGCYIGQEIIARTQHLGKLKRHLYLIELHASPFPGDIITDKTQETLGIMVNTGVAHTHLAVLEERAIHSTTLCSRRMSMIASRCTRKR